MQKISDAKHRNFTLVIGSGGIKPIAALPLLLFLEELQVYPNMLLACSGGSYISSFWANGVRGAGKEKEIFNKLDMFLDFVKNGKLFSTFDYRTLLGTGGYPLGRFDKHCGILFGDKLLKMYQNMSDNARLEDLPIKTVLQATNLDTGDPVFLEKGDLGTCIYASTALYPVLPPIEIEGKLLVDGGYHAELPVVEAVKRTNDVIVALVFDQAPSTAHSSFLTFFTTFVSQVAHAHSRTQNSFAVDLHQKEIIFIRYYFKESISIWDVDKVPYILEVGNKVLNEKKQEIIDVLAIGKG